AGRVLDPDGRPLAGAELYLAALWESPLNTAAPRARSGPDGRFALPAPKSELARHLAAARPVDVVAVANGFGMAWRPGADFPPKEDRDKIGLVTWLPAASSAARPELKLVRDTPLTGLVETPDGEPVKGATVQLEFVCGNDANDLSAWVAAVRRGDDFGAAR